MNLKSIFIPITCYNVSAYNNVIYFDDVTSAQRNPHVAVLTPGYYTTSDLLSAIAASMTAVASGATYTCAINTVTQRIIITSTLNFAMTFSNTLNSASEVLGFPNTDSDAVALTQTGTAPINLATTLCFNISINNATGTTSTTTASTSFVIPSLVPSVPSQMYYEIPLNFPQSVTFETTKYLNICIYDDQHRPLTFTNNWYMIVEVMEPEVHDKTLF